MSEKNESNVELELTDTSKIDDDALARLGVRRELKREFTSWSTLSFAFSILGCVATIASTFNTPVLLGGPASAVWSWFLGFWGIIMMFHRSSLYSILVQVALR